MVAIAATALMFSSASAEELKVDVIATKGAATVVRDEHENPVRLGMKLATGDTVRTTADGEVTLSWLGNVVKVYPLSRFRVQEAKLEGKTTKSTMKLETGKIFARAAKLMTPDSSFEIRTPTAIAGVRGSEIFVVSTPDKSSFIVVSGEFEVASDGLSVVLDQSTKVAFGPGATEVESTPQDVPAGEMKEFQAEAAAVYEEANVDTTSTRAPAEEQSGETSNEQADEQTNVQEVTETSIEETTTNDTITSPATDVVIDLQEGTGGVNLQID